MNKEIHNSSGQRLKSWDEKYIITLNVVRDNFSFNKRKKFLDVFGEHHLMLISCTLLWYILLTFCNADVRRVGCHLHALMCSVSDHPPSCE